MPDKHISLTPPRSSTDVGLDFERRVQALYQLLGYQVRHNVHLSSRQCDLICERHSPGGPTIRLLVECKFRDANTVPKSDVTQFVSEYDTLKHDHRLSAVAVVTNTGFSAETRALYAMRTDVLLITESSLSDELLNVTATLRRFTHAYKEDPIYRHYVELRDDKRRSLSAKLYDWISLTQSLCVLLGDFGTGKTTFMQRMKFVLSEKYIAGESSKIPCYFRLRDFARSPDLGAFMRSQLLNEFGSSDIAAFQHLLASGRILLMLDGFDEMGKHSNEQSRMNFFAALTPLFVGDGKYMITCRPSYFVSSEEMSRVFGQLSAISPRNFTVLGGPTSPLAQERRRSFDAFEFAASDWTLERSQVRTIGDRDIAYERLAPLSAEDIDKYLLLRQGDGAPQQEGTWETLRAKIRDTYDLEDLAKRPRLLNLIVETLPKIPNDIEPSPAVIYGHYTAAWLNHEYSKGEVRWLVNKRDKLLFTCNLAFHMYTNDLLRIHYTELPEEIAHHFGAKDPLELSYLASDLQGSSFLSGDGLGFFEFAHKSFAEFFAAVYLRDQLKDGNIRLIAQEPLSQEVLFFLGDLVYVDPELRASVAELFKKRKRKPKIDDPALVNLLAILGYSESTISKLTCVVQGVPLLKCVLCTLEGWDVTARTTEVSLDRCTLQDVTLTVPEGRLLVSKSKCTDLMLSRRTGAISATQTKMGDTSLASCLIDLSPQGSRFDRCTIRKTHFRGRQSWDVQVNEDEVMVTWNCDWNQVRFLDCVVEDSCFESLEIRMDLIDNLGKCELIAVLAQDLTDSHFSKLSEKGLIFRTRPAQGEIERRAMLLLKKCLVPGKLKSKRVESAREVMRALSAEDRLMLQWISGATRVHWAQRIEPISSIESHIAEFLAGLGSVEGGAKLPR